MADTVSVLVESGGQWNELYRKKQSPSIFRRLGNIRQSPQTSNMQLDPDRSSDRYEALGAALSKVDAKYTMLLEEHDQVEEDFLDDLYRRTVEIKSDGLWLGENSEQRAPIVFEPFLNRYVFKTQIIREAIRDVRYLDDWEAKSRFKPLNILLKDGQVVLTALRKCVSFSWLDIGDSITYGRNLSSSVFQGTTGFLEEIFWVRGLWLNTCSGFSQFSRQAQAEHSVSQVILALVYLSAQMLQGALDVQDHSDFCRLARGISGLSPDFQQRYCSTAASPKPSSQLQRESLTQLQPLQSVVTFQYNSGISLLIGNNVIDLLTPQTLGEFAEKILQITTTKHVSFFRNDSRIDTASADHDCIIFEAKLKLRGEEQTESVPVPSGAQLGRYALEQLQERGQNIRWRSDLNLFLFLSTRLLECVHVEVPTLVLESIEHIRRLVAELQETELAAYRPLMKLGATRAWDGYISRKLVQLVRLAPSAVLCEELIKSLHKTGIVLQLSCPTPH